MKWFRSNVQHGTRLALLALAVQFVLSFGHFHAIAARAMPALQTGTTQFDISFAGRLPAPDAVNKSAPQQPASNHDSDQQPDDFCAICAVVAMANAALSAAPPALLLPHAVEFVYLTTDAESVHRNSVRVAFQPRAPPAA
jgi:hypothetical protein